MAFIDFNSTDSINRSSIWFGPVDKTCMGSLYLSLGLFGIFENALIAYFMLTDPELKNPSYVFMSNLCLVNLISLIPTQVYTGLAFIFPAIFLRPWLIRVNSYLIGSSWIACLGAMTMTSFSRFIQITRSHLMSTYFARNRLKSIIALIWIVPFVAFGIVASYQVFRHANPMYTIKYEEADSWRFDYGRFDGRAVYWFLTSINIAIILVIGYLNIRSLIKVRRMRSRIRSNRVDTNESREIRLFFQVALSNLIYVICVIIFIACYHPGRRKPSPVAVFYHCIWAVQHLHTPMVYFAMNSRLRQRFMNLICRRRYSTTASSSSRSDRESSASKEHLRRETKT